MLPTELDIFWLIIMECGAEFAKMEGILGVMLRRLVRWAHRGEEEENE